MILTLKPSAMPPPSPPQDMPSPPQDMPPSPPPDMRPTLNT